MNEAHFNEVEKVLLYIGDARERAGKAAQQLSKANAEGHLVSALEEAEQSLRGSAPAHDAVDIFRGHRAARGPGALRAVTPAATLTGWPAVETDASEILCVAAWGWVPVPAPKNRRPSR